MGERVQRGQLAAQRMHAAAAPAAALALLVWLAAAAVLPPGTPGALISVALAGRAALPLYLLLARTFRVPELTELAAAATARLRRPGVTGAPRSASARSPASAWRPGRAPGPARGRSSGRARRR